MIYTLSLNPDDDLPRVGGVSSHASFAGEQLELREVKRFAQGNTASKGLARISAQGSLTPGRVVILPHEAAAKLVNVSFHNRTESGTLVQELPARARPQPSAVPCSA